MHDHDDKRNEHCIVYQHMLRCKTTITFFQVFYKGKIVWQISYGKWREDEMITSIFQIVLYNINNVNTVVPSALLIIPLKVVSIRPQVIMRRGQFRIAN